MGLKDKYQQAVGGPVAPPAQARPATAPAPAPTAGGDAPVRDLASMRAKLAQRQTGGTMNPAEAVASVTPELLEPRTQETPSGTAEPAPGWTENKNGLVVRDASAPAAALEAPASATPELTRGQKAAATRAANRAKAGATGSAPASSSPDGAQLAGSGAAATPAVGASAWPAADIPALLFRLAGAVEENHAVLVRIADSLQRIADNSQRLGDV